MNLNGSVNWPVCLIELILSGTAARDGTAVGVSSVPESPEGETVALHPLGRGWVRLE